MSVGIGPAAPCGPNNRADRRRTANAYGRATERSELSVREIGCKARLLSLLIQPIVSPPGDKAYEGIYLRVLMQCSAQEVYTARHRTGAIAPGPIPGGMYA